jgi:hypothetical protein
VGCLGFLIVLVFIVHLTGQEYDIGGQGKVILPQ